MKYNLVKYNLADLSKSPLIEASAGKVEPVPMPIAGPGVPRDLPHAQIGGASYQRFSIGVLLVVALALIIGLGYEVKRLDRRVQELEARHQ